MSPEPADEQPRFPISAVAMALIAMLLVGIASIAANVIVGERIRVLTRSQYAVQGAAKDIEMLGARKNAAMRLALVSGEQGFLKEASAVEPELTAALGRLEHAIRLPANRAAFAEVSSTEAQLHRIDERIDQAIEHDRMAEARVLAASPRYATLRRELDRKLAEIQGRSRAFVTSSREEVDHYLSLALAASLGAILLMALALYLVYRPTRSWARSLARLERKASAATQAKSDFLATMSHEIRTPLNGVIGFADLLLHDPTLADHHRRQVELIHNAGGLLLTVVNDILDFSKIEAGKLELDPDVFSIITLVDNCVSIVRPAADAKALTLSVDFADNLSPWYCGDAGRIRQVLLNLLNNAVKFTERGGVLIAARAGDVGSARHRLEIEVRDSGIGIPAARVDHLFDSFVQSDASIARRYGGTGLGLAISRQLVELMDGVISVESELGRGSTFRVLIDLPIARAPDVPLDVELPALRSAHVLLVEDLPMNQELAAEMLQRLGHSVTIVSSGEEAIERAASADFDVILMDIQMGGIDGLGATRFIRALDGRRGRVPILAMTANMLPAQVASYIAGGMNGHIAKPVRQRELAEALRRALDADTAFMAEPAASAAERFNADQYKSVEALLPPERLAKHVETFARLVRETAALAADHPTLEAQAHKVGSQAAMLGWTRLASRARALEDACGGQGNRAAALEAFRACLGDLGEGPRDAA